MTGRKERHVTSLQFCVMMVNMKRMLSFIFSFRIASVQLQIYALMVLGLASCSGDKTTTYSDSCDSAEVIFSVELPRDTYGSGFMESGGEVLIKDTAFLSVMREKDGITTLSLSLECTKDMWNNLYGMDVRIPGSEKLISRKVLLRTKNHTFDIGKYTHLNDAIEIPEVKLSSGKLRLEIEKRTLTKQSDSINVELHVMGASSERVISAKLFNCK